MDRHTRVMHHVGTTTTTTSVAILAQVGDNLAGVHRLGCCLLLPLCASAHASLSVAQVFVESWFGMAPPSTHAECGILKVSPCTPQAMQTTEHVTAGCKGHVVKSSKLSGQASKYESNSKYLVLFGQQRDRTSRQMKGFVESTSGVKSTRT